MAVLNIYQKEDLVLSSKDPNEIKNELEKVDIRLEQWSTVENLAQASNDEIELKYKDEIQKVLKDNKFSSFDIVNVKPDLNGIDELKKKFIPEHTHDDNEVRFFIDGEGLFCVHANDRIYQILCQQGDYIAVPAQTKHWFDMGSKADFKCIRFFENESGWIAKYTGSEISTQYPLFDEFTKNN